jgi:hypothetical protein
MADDQDAISHFQSTFETQLNDIIDDPSATSYLPQFDQQQALASNTSTLEISYAELRYNEEFERSSSNMTTSLRGPIDTFDAPTHQSTIPSGIDEIGDEINLSTSGFKGQIYESVGPNVPTPTYPINFFSMPANDSGTIVDRTLMAGHLYSRNTLISVDQFVSEFLPSNAELLPENHIIPLDNTDIRIFTEPFNSSIHLNESEPPSSQVSGIFPTSSSQIIRKLKPIEPIFPIPQLPEVAQSAVDLPRRRFTFPMRGLSFLINRSRRDRGIKTGRKNNAFGKKGTLKCAQCRNRRSAVRIDHKVTDNRSVIIHLSGYLAIFVGPAISGIHVTNYLARLPRNS